jgi:hypothetical protein
VSDCLKFHDSRPVIDYAPIHPSLIGDILLGDERVMFSLVQQRTQCAFGNTDSVLDVARRNSASVKTTETEFPYREFNQQAEQ